MIETFSHLLRMILAAGMCTGTLAYGSGRRADGSRRGIFLVGGIICSCLTTITIARTSGFRGDEISLVMLGFGFLLGSGVFFFLWRRGRLVGTHPHCRACEFDLFGKPNDATRCSECGADLSADRAVTIGLHHRRRGAGLAGVFVLMLGVMIGAKPTVDLARRTKWQTYKPGWWLVLDLDSTAVNRKGDAIDELARRIQRDELSSSNAKGIAERALVESKKGTRGPAWDLTQAYLQHHDDLDEVTLRKLMRAAGEVHAWEVMPVIARTFPASFVESALGKRGSTPGIDVRHEIVEERFGEQLIPASCVTRQDNELAPRGGHYELTELWKSIPDGPIEVTRSVKFHVTAIHRGKTVEETGEFTLRRKVTIVEPKDAVLQLVEPTEEELSATWVADVDVDDRRKVVVRFFRSVTRTPMLSTAWLVNRNGKKELGKVRFAAGDAVAFISIASMRPGDITRAGSAIELVPAPEEGVREWNRAPVLNQTVRIHGVKWRQSR